MSMTQISAPTIAPPVPIGTDVTVGSLTMRVEEAITGDGTATVANTNAQNDDSPAGLSYVLARVTVVSGVADANEACEVVQRGRAKDRRRDAESDYGPISMGGGGSSPIVHSW